MYRNKRKVVRVKNITKYVLIIIAEDDLSLIGNMSIPSHEDVENDSINALLDFEKELLPSSSLAIEQW